MTVIAPPAPVFPSDWPRLGIGCASPGDIFATYSEAEAQATFAAAWGAGVTYFDTAPWYGHGLSEHRLGTSLRDGPRDQVVVPTKVGRVYDPAPPGAGCPVELEGRAELCGPLRPFGGRV